MFADGFTASGAHTEMRSRIRAKYPEDWPIKYSDRSLLPSVFWVYYWYRKWLDDNIGSRDGIDCYTKAVQMIEEYNSKCKAEFPLPDSENYALISQTDSGETVAVVCNPFMRRVHQYIPQSGELVLIDATSNVDRNDTKLIHLVCPTMVGGLPLGEILCTREDSETLYFAFELLKKVLPAYAFYGRGCDVGPILFMTDDSSVLRSSLSRSWPQAEILLCQFHVLQAFWIWLWDNHHCIAKADRPILLKLFRLVLYSRCESELSKRLDELNLNPVTLQYPNFIEHLHSDILPKIKSWSTEYRVTNKLPTSNNNTNNLVECSFRYTKDIQLNRLKAYNLCDLLSLLLDNSEFYQNKCVDCANNVLEAWLKNCHSKYVPMKQTQIDTTLIQKIGQGCYLVPSESDENLSYLVDMSLRSCSCPAGQLRGPCKHKHIVSISQNIGCFDVIPTKNPVMRQLFMKLGSGKDLPLDYFLPLGAPTDYGQCSGLVTQALMPVSEGDHQQYPVTVSSNCTSQFFDRPTEVDI